MESASACALVLALLVYVRGATGGSRHEGLAIWIDRKEVQKLAGVDMDIFVVKDGVVPDYMTLQTLDEMLPVLPAEVNVVNMTWQASSNMYTYNFTHLRSLDPLYLYDPLLSIPDAGTIPSYRTVFQLTIPCNGKASGIASLYIKMHISRAHRTIPGSPLKLILRKTCKTFAACKLGCLNGGKCVRDAGCVCTKDWHGDRCETPTCSLPCRNGGLCEKPNVCRCRGGFHGDQCHLHQDCETPCQNGGVCQGKNSCQCPLGYHGNNCQRPTCRKECHSHGTCVAPNRCKCHPGWFGRYCNKNQMLYYELFLRRQNRRRERKRKLRHKRNKYLEHGYAPSRYGNSLKGAKAKTRAIWQTKKKT